MAFRYNGMCNTERMALTALDYRVQLEQLKLAEGAMAPSPESLLNEIVKEAKLSEIGVIDHKAILKAFYQR